MDTNPGSKICNFCGEQIAASTRRCPYCGSLLETNFEQIGFGDTTKPFDTPLTAEEEKNHEEQPEAKVNLEKDHLNTPAHESNYIHMGDVIGDNGSEPYRQSETASGNNENQNIFREGAPEFPNSENDYPQQHNTLYGQYNPVDNQPQSVPNRVVDVPAANSMNIQNGSHFQSQYTGEVKPPLSNGFKVLLTTISNIIPGLGQIIGVIFAIFYMNSEGDKDRKSFGVALLIASVALFIVYIFACCVVLLALSPDSPNY